jgi:hypothetical protein
MRRQPRDVSASAAVSRRHVETAATDQRACRASIGEKQRSPQDTLANTGKARPIMSSEAVRLIRK